MTELRLDETNEVTGGALLITCLIVAGIVAGAGAAFGIGYALGDEGCGCCCC